MWSFDAKWGSKTKNMDPDECADGFKLRLLNAFKLYAL